MTKKIKKTVKLSEGYVRKGGVNPKPSKPRPEKPPVAYKLPAKQTTAKKKN